jgi:RHS repeat-associated protein
VLDNANNVLAETDLNGNVLYYYIQGLGMIARVKAINSQPYYYHHDFRGSTVAITNANQTITHKYQYGAFGETEQVQEEDFNAYRYVGKYGVGYENKDLTFMRARYYQPNVGRFNSEDPIWATNLYTYGDNNPINKFDANGLRSEGFEFIPEIIEKRIEKHLAKSKIAFKIGASTIEKLENMRALEAIEKSLDGDVEKWFDDALEIAYKTHATKNGLEIASNVSKVGLAKKVLAVLPISTVFALYDNRKNLNTAQGVANVIQGMTEDIADYIAPFYGEYIVKAGVIGVGLFWDYLIEPNLLYYLSGEHKRTSYCIPCKK